MRVVAGMAVIAQGLTSLGAGPPAGSVILHVLAMVAGIVLLVGLWTPISGTLVGVFGLWNIISQPGDPWANILLATTGAALAMLGPGAWSVDARLFGWKRIDVHNW